MHQNTYNHEESEPSYQRYISNIAYRFKFEVVHEEDRILKIENGVETVVISTDEAPRNTLNYHAWMKLKDEYGYYG
jgi:hypothetical protein